MKKILKYAITAVVAAAILITMGAVMIVQQRDLERQRTTFQSTEFEFSIVSPSFDQVKDFRASSCISGISPYRTFETKLSAKTSETMFLLFADSDDAANVGLFNEKTVIDGDFFGEGIQLDLTAAEKLHANVGDVVRFSLGGKQFSHKVAAIHAPCTYPGYDQGVGFERWSTDIEALFSFPISYNVAFADVSDNNAFLALTDGYVPLGQLTSQERYISDFKADHNIPPNTTQEEWENQILTAYREYVEKFIADYKNNSNGTIAEKSVVAADVESGLLSKQTFVSRMGIIAAVVSSVALSVLFALFVFLDMANDRRDCLNGIAAGRICLKNIVVGLCAACAVALLTAVVLVVIAALNGFYAAFTPIILQLSLPVLMAIVPDVCCNLVLLRMLRGGRSASNF